MRGEGWGEGREEKHFPKKGGGGGWAMNRQQECKARSPAGDACQVHPLNRRPSTHTSRDPWRDASQERIGEALAV